MYICPRTSLLTGVNVRADLLNVFSFYFSQFTEEMLAGEQFFFALVLCQIRLAEEEPEFTEKCAYVSKYDARISIT